MKPLKLLSCFSFFIFSFSFVSAQFVLYGTTWSDYYGKGTVFKCTPSGLVRDVCTFDTVPGGMLFADDGLILANDGNMYGTTRGGTYGYGAVYKVTTRGQVSVIANFNSAVIGRDPITNLLQAYDGNLYGTCDDGGTYGQGTIFKCTLSGTLTAIASLNGQSLSSLAIGPDSMLYGVTNNGGTYNKGTIFKCSLSGTVTTLFNFDTANGSKPNSERLLWVGDSVFYGTTTAGGASDSGTLFKCTPSGVLTTLYSFPHGYNLGGLILASDGNLYGTTQFDGIYGMGTIFKATLNGTVTTVATFNGHDGAWPWAPVMEASDSNLYGCTTQGGLYGFGTVFQYKLSGTLTTLVNFDNNMYGGYPERESLVEIKPKDTNTGINAIRAISGGLRVYPNPFSSATTITLDVAGSYYLELYDITGKNMKQIELTGNSYTLSAEGLAKGMYFIRVTGKDNSVIGTSKIVVQ